jgi:hypothetical protein
MRGKFTLLGLALALASPGCTLMHTGARVVSSEFTECLDDACERVRNRKWAAAAWDRVCTTEPQSHSDDYGRGFKDGFAEHLYHGGTQPPLVAPARYRHIHYQTPEGYRAIEDWFAGYRHGVEVAAETGMRRWITGPSALAVHAPPAGPHEVHGASHTSPGESGFVPAALRNERSDSRGSASPKPQEVRSDSRGFPPPSAAPLAQQPISTGSNLPVAPPGRAGGSEGSSPSALMMPSIFLAPRPLDTECAPARPRRTAISQFGLPLTGPEEPAIGPTIPVRMPAPVDSPPSAEESEPPTRLGGPLPTQAPPEQGPPLPDSR